MQAAFGELENADENASKQNSMTDSEESCRRSSGYCVRDYNMGHFAAVMDMTFATGTCMFSNFSHPGCLAAHLGKWDTHLPMLFGQDHGCSKCLRVKHFILDSAVWLWVVTGSNLEYMRSFELLSQWLFA
jgi:hypothetical protein